MKKIQEAANEYALSREDNDYTIETEMAYTSGVKFANTWIPVEEELPEDADTLIETEKYIYAENPVLVRTINGKYSVSKRSKFKGNENSKWEWIGSSAFSDSVTHWRPIERN